MYRCKSCDAELRSLLEIIDNKYVMSVLLHTSATNVATDADAFANGCVFGIFCQKKFHKVDFM